MPQRRAGGAPDSSGDVWVQITRYARKYFISRSGLGDDELIDDEAQLEITAAIQAISPAHKKHLGATMQISLVSAHNYSVEKPIVPAFFGSLTFRRSQHSALAYLPPQPFWQLPAMITEGSTWLRLGWSSMHRGSADLTSVFFGDDTDLQQLGSTCVCVDVALQQTL